MDLFWEMRQAQQMANVSAAASSASFKAGKMAGKVDDLQRRLDKLTMICAAMWEFLRERTDLTDEQLNERVMQIDLRDGQADGKVRQAISNCPKCGRVMSPRHTRCLYCGAEKLEPGSFDGVL